MGLVNILSGFEEINQECLQYEISITLRLEKIVEWEGLVKIHLEVKAIDHGEITHVNITQDYFTSWLNCLRVTAKWN